MGHREGALLPGDRRCEARTPCRPPCHLRPLESVDLAVVGRALFANTTQGPVRNVGRRPHDLASLDNALVVAPHGGACGPPCRCGILSDCPCTSRTLCRALCHFRPLESLDLAVFAHVPLGNTAVGPARCVDRLPADAALVTAPLVKHHQSLVQQCVGLVGDWVACYTVHRVMGFTGAPDGLRSGGRPARDTSVPEASP